MSISVNESRILREIWLNPGVSRSAVSRCLGLSKAAVTKIVTGMLDEGLVLLSGSPDETGSKGRRPTGLTVNGSKGVIIGIEMRTDQWFSVAINLQGNRVSCLESGSVDAGSTIIDSVDAALQTVSGQLSRQGYALLGVGVGLSGLVNPYQGVILRSNPLDVAEPLHITAELARRHNVPVVVENDANCCCWKTMLDKRADRDRNFMCILGEFRRTQIGQLPVNTEADGIAVGLGIVLKDSVLHGTGFSAGEFQSVFKVVDNPTQFNIPTIRLADIGRDHDLWNLVAIELARNVALLVNVLNITTVRVFGDFTTRGSDLARQISTHVQYNWLYDNTVELRVEIDEDLTHAVATGAAAFLLHRFFSRPDVWDGEQSEYPPGIELLREVLSR